ncbi:MAG: GDP-mannose 4,6-dehydratase [Promethearchaeota archaeon]
MAKVLITGGGGFIGSHVAEIYANQSDIDEVIVIDNLSRSILLNKKIKSLRYNWDYLHKYQKIKFYEKDICEFDFLKKVLNNNDIDIVIHTAAQTAVTISITNPIPDFKNNVVGTFNLLESIRLSKSDPCVVLCSTNKVFGNNVNNCEIIENESRYSFSEKDSYGISEDFPIDLCEHTPYGASKLCSDLYFQEYGHLYGLKTAVFRMSCIYGTRQFGLEDQGWIAHFIISAITGKKLTIYGDGKQVRDVLYVSDLIQAFESFIQRAKSINHEVFCMGGGPENTLSLLELIDILKRELNENVEYEFDEWRPSDQKVYISDIRKAEKVLNWRPKISVNDGVKELINWVKFNKNLFI